MMLRITLLVLVTGLFALVWTQDQAHSNASRRKSATVTNNSPAKVDPSTHKPIARQAAEAVGPPLPAGIVPGEYRAVSSTGIVRHLKLSREDVQSQSEFFTREVYETAGQNERWYFIRVVSHPEEMIPAVAERTRAGRPAAAESSEGNLNRQASRIILKAGQQAAGRFRQFIENPKTAGGVLEMLRSWKRLSSDEPEHSRL